MENIHGIPVNIWVAISGFGISIDKIEDDENGIAKKIYMSVPEIKRYDEGVDDNWKNISSNIKKSILLSSNIENLEVLSKPIKGLIWTDEMGEKAYNEALKLYYHDV